MTARYKHVSLPDKLMETIDKYIQDNPKFDFRSRAEVVKFSLRMLFSEQSPQTT